MADSGDEETAGLLVALAPKLAELRNLVASGGPSNGGASGGHSLHWRYELMATWCVLNTLQATYNAHDVEGGSGDGDGDGDGSGAGSTGGLKASVWRWFIRALKAGAGQPMQKLGLSGVMSMVSLELDHKEGKTAMASTGGSAAMDGVGAAGGGGNTDAEAATGAGTTFSWRKAFAPSDEKSNGKSNGNLNGNSNGTTSTSVILLLTDRETVRELCSALAFDRKLEANGRGGGGGAAQWSAGVEELMNEAMRTGPTIYPKTRLSHVSYVFKSKHARQVKSVVNLCGADSVKALLEGAVANLKV